MTNNFRSDLYSPPSIDLIDGVPSDDSIQEMAYLIESAFNSTSNAIGNIHGRGEYLSDGTKFINNIASAIGNMSNDIAMPYGTNFLGYKQIFSVNDKKYFYLDLIPTGNIVIDDGINPSVYWNQRSTYGSLKEDGDFVVDGIKLVFFKEPSTQFSITYDGKYFSLNTNEDGYMPNVIPDQTLRSQNKIGKPVLSISTNGRYRLTVDKPASTVLGELEDVFEYSLASYLQKYISPNGAIECPQAYVSIWVKDKDSFIQLDTQKIFIISPREFEFTTNENIFENDEFAIYIANRSITEDIKSLFKALFTHSHNGLDGSAVIEHSSLAGIIPKSNKENITYGGSSIPGNDHPQYFNREGYVDDPGTYNNAILGDVLIGSTSELSQFNNTYADSNKLLFGSTSDGHSLKRRHLENDLLLYSSFNGLSINYDNSENESFGLNIKGAKFGIDPLTHNLIVSSESGRTIFRNADKSGLQTVIAGEINGDDIFAERLIEVANQGEMTVGPFHFTNILDDLVVSANLITNVIRFLATVSIDEALIDNADINTLLISKGNRILFGSDPNISHNSFFTTLEGNIGAYKSPLALRFISTGKNTGISFNDEAGNNKFFNIYTSTNSGGESTDTDHDTYIETGIGKLYLLKDTDRDITEDDKIYSWRKTEPGKIRIDNLHDWPKSDLVARYGTFRSINLDQSNGKIKNGLSFGDYNGIYVTGNSNPCPPGIMVVEVQNGLVIANTSSSANSCESHEYAPLTSGIFQSFGGISTDESITALGDLTIGKHATSDSLTVNSETSINGSLKVDALSKFNSDVIFNNPVEANADVNITSNLTVLNTIYGKSITLTGPAELNGITYINNSLFVEGQTQINSLIANGSAIFNDALRVGGSASFDGRVVYSGDTTFNANLSIRGSVDVKGSLDTTVLSVSNVAAFQGISEFNSIATFNSGFNAKDASFSGDIIIGNSGSKISMNGELNINTDTLNIGGNMEIYGETRIKDKIFASSSLNVDGSTSVGANLTVGANLDVASTINANSAKFEDSVIANRTIQTSGSLIAGSLYVDKSSTINGDLSIGGLNVNDYILANPKSEATLGNVYVNGAFEQSSNSELFSVAGDANFKSELKVQGEMRVNSTLNVGNDANGIKIFTNSIKVNGSGGILEVKNAVIDKIKGLATDIPVPPSILKYAPEMIQLISGQEFVTFESSVNFQNKALFQNTAIFSDTIFATEIQFLGNEEGAINIIAKKARYAD